MIPGNEWISPTRVTGLFAYTVSFGACAWRWVTARRGDLSGVWLLLTSLQLGLVVDVAFDLRWKLHAFWMDRAIADKVYSERRSPQLVALVVLFGLLLAGGVLIQQRFRGRRGVQLALTGTMLSVGLWCCEALSYHYMDLVLYRMHGGLMMVSLLWVGLAALTFVGVWMDEGLRCSGLRTIGRRGF